MNSTFKSKLRTTSNLFSTSGSVEKYIKSSTYIPKYSGADPGIIIPEYSHGAFSDGWRPIVASTFFDF